MPDVAAGGATVDGVKSPLLVSDPAKPKTSRLAVAGLVVGFEVFAWVVAFLCFRFGIAKYGRAPEKSTHASAILATYMVVIVAVIFGILYLRFRRKPSPDVR